MFRELELVNNIDKKIILVNDCSTAGSGGTIRAYAARYPEMGLHLLMHAVNQGKDAALHTGLRAATGEYVIIQDADLEYDPKEYNMLMKPIMKGFADVVFGSRFLGGNPHRILFFWHNIGNNLLTFFSNMMTDLNLTDMKNCCKLFRRDIIQGLKLEENCFGFEPEVTAKVARVKDVRIYEVSIRYYGRTYAEGKKNGLARWVSGHFLHSEIRTARPVGHGHWPSSPRATGRSIPSCATLLSQLLTLRVISSAYTLSLVLPRHRKHLS